MLLLPCTVYFQELLFPELECFLPPSDSKLAFLPHYVSQLPTVILENDHKFSELRTHCFRVLQVTSLKSNLPGIYQSGYIVSERSSELSIFLTFQLQGVACFQEQAPNSLVPTLNPGKNKAKTPALLSFQFILPPVIRSFTTITIILYFITYLGKTFKFKNQLTKRIFLFFIENLSFPYNVF